MRLKVGRRFATFVTEFSVFILDKTALIYKKLIFFQTDISANYFSFSKLHKFSEEKKCQANKIPILTKEKAQK